MELIKQNPGCAYPLRIQLDVECNVPEEKMLDNMQVNARRQKKWVQQKEAHDRIALICGSGPSLRESLNDIRDRYHRGNADLFALNGSAKFLQMNKLLPDCQILLDARPETAQLIGPAFHHMFASQCDPSLFEKVPNAQLWHATYGDYAPEFPDYHDDYVMVGGGHSIGNTVLPLIYALGYREIHCYGYDSSNKGEATHAFAQPLNDGDPSTYVYFRGKQYISSLVMKLQADHFPWRARELQKMGCKIYVHGYGLLPDMFNAPPLGEREKYELLWQHPEYRGVAPGEFLDKLFIRVSGAENPELVVDFGTGTGRGAWKLHDEYGLDIIMLDFAENCLDDEVKKRLGPDFEFYPHSIEEPFISGADYGYCTDVMEHIAEDRVDKVLKAIMASVPKCFLAISLIEDNLGSLIGETLHLTVRPYKWWLDKFKALGFTIEWSEDQAISACFYISTT